MRILIIEDEKMIRNKLRKSLKDECYAVDTAEDGGEGLYLAETNNYDLIVLDNILPKKTGLEVCRALRDCGKTVPIIILSVRSETTSKVDLLNAGADDYLTKPFSMDELSARIKALLRRPKQLSEENAIIDNLTVDKVKHIAKRGDKEIYLTRKEFALLLYMINNQDIVLSRSMIMEHVWDTNLDPFSNTIESHILSLRKKIDSAGRVKLIHTIPGIGYKMAMLNR